MGSKPFAYNPNTGTTISGVTNYGTLAVATGDVDFKSSGLDWYMGPDESSGYIFSNIKNNKPQFWRSLGLTDADFILAVKKISKQNITTTSQANTWLASNNFYTTFVYLLKTKIIKSGSNNSLSINDNGQVWGWGYNNFGQLGDNSTISKITPVSILGNKKTFCQITGGNYHSLGIDKNGQVWCWGYNFTGQLGNNSTTARSTPVSILGNKKTFCQIACGSYHSLGIDKNGQVWGWGYNNIGQLGDNSVTSRRTPVSILGNKKTFCQISGGYSHSLGIDKNGQVWSWGFNIWGQLGDNSITSRRIPVSILGTKKTFCQIAGGDSHSLGLDIYGQVWSWGFNNSGQLGDNSITSRRIPVSILGNKKTFCKIATGYSHSLGIDKNGQVWSWGYNNYGQLGDNSIISKRTPVSILGTKKTFCDISAGQFHSLGIDKNGQVWSWGYNNYGQLGNNSIVNKYIPIIISGAKKTFCQIAGGNSHSLGIDKNGQVWSWGYNSDGQLGDNSLIQKNTPVSILGNKKTFCQISGGYSHSLGIDKNGQVWSWGYNAQGQLGDNSTINRSTPVSILGNKKTFCQISAGNIHSLGIDNKGQVWAWGYNWYGQLGDNSTISKITPISILGNKKTFCQIAGGDYHSLGIDKNGQVWGWGYNNSGQLGDNSTSLTHEFSHSYEKYKKPIESIINRNNYTTYKQIRMNIKPLDEFSHLLYLISETENTVRPSEVASEMKQKNITKSQFNDFIKNNDTYKKLMKAKNFSYEKLKKELLENIKDIDIFIKEHRDIYDDIPNSNEEKVNLILKTYYSSIINLKMQNIQSILKLDHPFAQFFLSDIEERIDIHDKYAKKITKQKKFDKFFEFEEKRINFAADKMIKKIYKLYDMAKDDNTTEKLKISKEIKDWNLYHEVKKTKTEFTTEIKKTEFRKKK